MKVLFIAPPQNSGYFNLCYNFTELGEVSTYVAKQSAYADSVDVLDASKKSPNSWKKIGSQLKKGYDVVAIWNRFDNLSNAQKVAKMAKEANPATMTITYGQPSTLVPRHFTREYELDAVVKHGPWELVLEGYLGHLAEGGKTGEAKGLLMKEDGWRDREDLAAPGEPFWEYADLSKLPLKDYFEIYKEEGHIAGFKGTREMSFSVSRGCKMQCNFCNAHKIHGKKDVRKPVDYIMDYVDENFGRYGFDFVSTFSPILTLDRGHAIGFSRGMGERGIDWKCVSHIRHVDDGLLEEMGKGGCQRIGFGLETMAPEAERFIKKKFSRKEVEKAIDACRKHEVIPMMFLMLGIPGETRETFRSTIKFLREKEAEIRMTAFTPFYEIKDSMSIDQIMRYDRESITAENVKGMKREEFEAAVKDIKTWAEGEKI